MNTKQECKKLINSFKYAIEGFVSSFKTERNMKIHIVTMFVVILAGLYLKLNYVEWCFITISIVLVIGAELFNTAIETVVNMICSEKNSNAKLAKDISASAVLTFAIGSAIIGLIIFIPKFVT